MTGQTINPSAKLADLDSPIPAGAPSDSSCIKQPLKKIWNWRGYDIQYTVAGQGVPLVLIHGFGASIGHWRKNIPVLAASGYQVYALDLLGFGGSEKPALDYSLDLWEVLLRDFWRHHIRVPAVFVGNSIGGLLVLMTLANSPHIAQGGVLLNCAGSLNHRPEDLPRALGVVMGLFGKVVSSPVLGPLIFSQVRRRFRIRGALKQVYGNRDAITPELVELLYQPSCDFGAQKVFASILTGPPGPRPSELIPQIQHPLLVLWGEIDPWTPIQGATLYQAMADDPDQTVTFQSLPDTGHCPHDERPEIVNQLILEWLNTQIS
ncbi:alpha/beta fold hydrolase [Leptolyngbya cf. ectocarpi LEGE 11479]|uniref:Alpha/beta fold hydrolase n=1 Tax=Leptolyngbya cf. ectocarpi LEGE 11479 TaxID=1828722 RepID=A0A928ZUS3_LEPEC|nr:alpha/beta fold hydrolase [Leptolyngbya ectocarpi]MBE9067840.1 alpha/beta fold hydrolase [Leptolyngbya cf. ectocarpi LEGE 11479]